MGKRAAFRLQPVGDATPPEESWAWLHRIVTHGTAGMAA